MSWNMVSSSSNNDKKETNYAKFNEGDSYIKILSIEPAIRWQHWVPKVNRALTCPGNDICPICALRKAQKAAGETPNISMSKRFSMVIYNYTTNKEEIMEQGTTFFEDLRDIKVDVEKDGKTLRDVQIRVRRRGTGTNTSYRLDVHNDEPITKEEQAIIDNIVDLKEFFKPATVEQCQAAIDGASWEEILELGKTEEVEYEVK